MLKCLYIYCALLYCNNTIFNISPVVFNNQLEPPFHTRHLAIAEPLDYLSDLCQGVFRLCLLHRGHVSWAQELLKVLLPPLDNIPSLGQQFSAEHSLGRALLSLPETLIIFPNFLEANRMSFYPFSSALTKYKLVCLVTY